MASTPPLRRLPLRVWCGAFPLFALPAAASDACDAVSTTFFASDAFVRLRTQLRLKLQETPSPTQPRRMSATNAATQYTELLALTHQYARHVVALLRFLNTSGLRSTVSEEPYEPLFFGVGATDLRRERRVGKEHRLAFAVPVDVVLTLVLRGQLHALHAETLVDQGLALQSEPVTAAAEASWRRSARAFTQAASVASATLSNASSAWRTSDPQLATLVQFFTSLSTQCIVLARVAQMHRAATRLRCLILLDETAERLARNAAVCARYAHTVALEACGVAAVLDDSSFSRQLAWVVQSYAVRWRAIFYSYEQTILQLDFYPEIAIHFNELVHRGDKLPSLPACRHHDPHPLDRPSGAAFTRLAQELQQSHTAQLSELLDARETLLTLCHRKCGPLWTLPPLPRELYDALERIPALDALFEDEHESLGEGEDVENDDDNALTVDAIQRNVQCALERANAEAPSLSACSTRAVQEENVGSDDTPSTATTTAVAVGIYQGNDKPLPSRPSSAGSTHTQRGLAHSHSRPSTDWVTMRVGDKVLHFEPLPSPAPSSSLALAFTARPPRPLTAGSTLDRRRRHAVPMILEEEDNGGSPSSLLKPRPSSSPSSLSSKKPLPTRGGTHKTLTWVPVRTPCALCARRFTRHNLPGVVVMKRIFDLRRKWGMVLSHDAKKYSAASALYARASVCVLCHDILTFEDDLETRENDRKAPSVVVVDDDVGVLIQRRIQQLYVQRPLSSGKELLLDVAVDQRARQSSTNFGLAAHYAVQRDAVRTAHTKTEPQPWWEVDLGNYHVVHSVKVWLREDTLHDYDVVGGQGTNTTATARGMMVVVQSDGALRPHLNVGLYPLHLSVSMKTGVGRDVDDVLASAVSSYCAQHKPVQPITWLAPPNCRGRFVRLQSAATAFLHIEKVQVFVAQELPTHTARRKRDLARSTLQRAAFRASVISKKLSHRPHDPMDPQHETTTTTTAAAVASPAVRKGFGSAFADPEHTEKRRISRLYLKFKGLLDARSKYHTEEQRREE